MQDGRVRQSGLGIGQSANWIRFTSAIVLTVASVMGALLLGPLSTPAGAAAKTYYVDCSGGNDNHAGTSASTAWKSVDKANKGKLQPGDSLLLKRGCTWSQQLKAYWNGTSSAPITIGAYGSGNLPKLQNQHDGNVRIMGSYQIIENLQTYNSPNSYGQIDTSCNNQPVGWVVGFNIVDGAHNTVRNSIATHEAIGVAFNAKANNNHIVNNQIINNDGAWVPASKGIRGGTGIVLYGKGNEIARNHFEGNGTLCKDESISIELFTASNSNIHHNTSYSDKGFIELGSSSTVQSSGNTVAYNVHTTGKSGARFMVTPGPGAAHGPVMNTSMFNNVIYYTGSNSQGVVCMGCTNNVLRMQNNIIDVVDKALYIGNGQSLIESNNIYWVPSGNVPKWNFVQNWNMASSSAIANPKLANPGNRNFHLQAGSPAINDGSHASVDAGYSADMDGNAVPQGGTVDIGAYETSTAANNPSAQSTGAISLPGRIQAEDYRKGGEGTGYHDTTAANLGGSYRSDAVDIQPCSDSTTPSGQKCFNVGWPSTGEWLAYDVNVSSGGTFHISARVASIYDGEKFHIEIDGKNVTGSISVPKTNGWQNWTTVRTASFSVGAGAHTLKFVDETKGFNVNYFDLST
jgi:hypothetical protein